VHADRSLPCREVAGKERRCRARDADLVTGLALRPLRHFREAQVWSARPCAALTIERAPNRIPSETRSCNRVHCELDEFPSLVALLDIEDYTGSIHGACTCLRSHLCRAALSRSPLRPAHSMMLHNRCLLKAASVVALPRTTVHC